MNFEKELADLSVIVTRNSAVNEVLNVFHSYVHYFSQNHISGVLKQFALDKEDVSLEIGEEGKIVGAEQLRKHFAYMPRLAKQTGVLVYHYVTSEVVEVAEDGKTAKVTALSPSCDAMGQAQLQNWIFGKYYVDMIKTEDGSWKLWHVQWFRTFETPVTVGWLKVQTSHDAEINHPKMVDVYADPAARNESSYPADWRYPKHYDTEQVNYLMPEPPKPYKSWDGITSMEFTRDY